MEKKANFKDLMNLVYVYVFILYKLSANEGMDQKTGQKKDREEKGGVWGGFN